MPDAERVGNFTIFCQERLAEIQERPRNVGRDNIIETFFSDELFRLVSELLFNCGIDIDNFSFFIDNDNNV